MAQIDKYGYHEVIDRLHLILSLVDEFLREHEAVKENPELLSLIGQAEDSLSDAYQLAGKISFEKFPEAE